MRSHFVSWWSSILKADQIVLHHVFPYTYILSLRTMWENLPEDNISCFQNREWYQLLENRLWIFHLFGFSLWRVFLLSFACLFCNCGQPAASQGAPRKRKCCGRPHRATLVSMVNNCSEIFLRCLAKPKQLWHWIRMKKNSTAGKNKPLEMATLWKDPSACRFSWITSGLVLCQSWGNKYTVLLKANGLYWERLGAESVLTRDGEQQSSSSRIDLFSAPFLCWISHASVEDHAVTFTAHLALWCFIFCYLLQNGIDEK